MSPQDGLNRVLDALTNHGGSPSSKGGYHSACCPAHDDSTPSLSVQHIEPKAGDAGGRARVRCHAGCDELDVLTELGLTLADLYDDPIPSNARGAIREHPYTSPSGRLIGSVQRLGDTAATKTFRPLTHNGRNWAHKATDELKSTPYRLPDVVAAIDQDKPVWIVEGERDVDTLATHGITATCNQGGGGKWTVDHAHWLKGADVTVCRDRDPAGEKHAETVIATLAGVVAAVRLVEPAEGKDITDHLSAGRTLAEVVTVDITDQAPIPARRLRPVKASEVTMRRLRWLWTQRILLGGLTLLAGREGLGKSTVAVDVTARVTRGVLDGEHYRTPRNVIYINSEDARDYTIVPRLVAAGADLDRVIFLDAIRATDTGESSDSLVLPLDTDLLAAAVTEHDAVLVVLDAATSVIDGRLDGDKDRQMRQGLEAIAREIGERTGVAILGIVHFGKRESTDTGKLILGSIAWSQVTRSTLAVARDDETGQIIVSATKANLSPGDTPSLAARIVSHRVDTSDGATSVGKVEWLGETDRDARDLLGGPQPNDDGTERDEAEAWLSDYLAAHHGEAPAGQVIKDAEKAGFAKHTIQRARKRARVKSRKSSLPQGKAQGTPWVWALPTEGDAGSEDDTEGDEENQHDARARKPSCSSPSVLSLLPSFPDESAESDPTTRALPPDLSSPPTPRSTPTQAAGSDMVPCEVCRRPMYVLSSQPDRTICEQCRRAAVGNGSATVIQGSATGEPLVATGTEGGAAPDWASGDADIWQHQPTGLDA